MGFRRKNGNDQVNNKVKKKKRKKDTCCYKYGPTAWIRKLCTCIRKRFERRLKRKVFGVSKLGFMSNTDTSKKKDKKLRSPSTNDDYDEIKISRNLIHNSAILDKLSVEIISLKDLHLIEGHTASELKSKYNVTGPKAKVLDKLVKEYKKKKISTSLLPKSSKLSAKELDKNKLDKILNGYEKLLEKSTINILKNMDKDKLKKKFSLTGSKAKVFSEIMDGYRKGKISLTQLTQSKTESKKFNKNMNKVDSKGKNSLPGFGKMLKKSLVKVNLKNGDKNESNRKFSLYGYEKLLKNSSIKNMDKDELKKKFSVTGSKAKVLSKMIDGYRKGKISLTQLTQSKTGHKTLNENMDKNVSKRKFSLSGYEKMLKKSVLTIDNLKHMDKDELKKKISLSGSESKVFNKMIDDYRKGNISLTQLTQSKTGPKKLNKQRIDQMLKVYEETKKRK